MNKYDFTKRVLEGLRSGKLGVFCGPWRPGKGSLKEQIDRYNREADLRVAKLLSTKE